MNARELTQAVADGRNELVKDFCSMLRISAVGPESGGAGEAERAQFLVDLVRSYGFESVEVMDSPDSRVPSGRRPNIIVRLKGTTDRNLWVVTHMDTVPVGDPSAWRSPPFEPRVEDGKIFARGSEDNGQELFASLFGLKALLTNGITPECNIGLVFVSDEETGNTHGIEFLLSKGIFKKEDMAVVPDHGEKDGSGIVVIEKGIAWIVVEVVGAQTHASTPEKGVNALEVAARFMLLTIERLRRKYDACDPLFDTPCSTFVPTRCEANGPNINTVPGRQRFAFDFRVLPVYGLDEILTDVRAAADEIERSTGAKINLNSEQRTDAAPKTSTDAEVVRRLSSAIEAVRGLKPRPFGMGGGTCAAPFRRMGMQAAVWSTSSQTAHDANEYCKVGDVVSDAQVYALLFAGKNLKSD
jgi:succinyl-diaminopimelate desuccinylase